MDRGACWGCGLWGCRESDTTKYLTHATYLGQKKETSELFGSMPKHVSVDDKLIPNSIVIYICMYVCTDTYMCTHIFLRISSLYEANVLLYQLKPVSETVHFGRKT